MANRIATAAVPRSESEPWHAMPLAEVMSKREAKEHGLSSNEAAERLKRFGPNELPHQPPPAWWQIALRQFKSPLIYILGVAAIFSLGVGDFTDAAFIAAVLAVNAIIGGYQEWKAERSAQALQHLLKIRAQVMRDGEVSEIDAEQVVPGDIVWLESGVRVPADLRLMTAHALEIDESLLTGESLAVTKDPSWSGEANTPVGDRLSMAFAGSIVTRGRGRGVVVDTGHSTMIGQLALDVSSATAGKPPLVERMERFGKVIAVVVVISAAVIGMIGVLGHGRSVAEMFMFAIAMAVSAIPEGLPAAMTVALSVATLRMARRGVIVRRLHAVEGLGSCTMIASDKTGTLTCNELTVREIRLRDGRTCSVSGQGYVPEGEIRCGNQTVRSEGDDRQASLLRAAALCNEADLHRRGTEWVWRGDPTEVALLSMAHKGGQVREALLERYPQLNEIPFEPEHRFAATFHRMNEKALVCVKGAPERVLAMCRWDDDGERQRLARAAEEMAEQGYRVLGLAEGEASLDHLNESAPGEPSNLTFLGLVGMIDPLRPGVKQAVHDCHDAGITVCMVTGDHPVTALAIGRELGMAESADQVITGAQLQELSEAELTQAIQKVRVFARVSPRQKLDLVNAARRAGHYVAVTGDGVNDAPALRAANIGVAMGKAGTDVAREAAELVISDDNFATIVAGVEEGRVAYDNVRKVIYLLISTGAAEVLVVLMAVISGLPLPLLPVQFLWLNLVTNGIQGVALAFEPSEGDVLKRKPRPPRQPIFDRLMIERTIVAAGVMSVVSFIVFRWMLENGWSEASARNTLLLLLVLFENIQVGNSRSETKSAFALSPLRSPILLTGTIAAQLLHILILYIPFGHIVLKTEPVGIGQWFALLGLASTVLIAIEIHKWWWARRHPEDLPHKA